MTLYLILGVCLAIWAYGLWRRGFFGLETSSRERWAYAVRNLLWLGSILIVSWPLERYRQELGEVTYVGSAFLILGAFFVLGLAAAKLILRSNERTQ